MEEADAHEEYYYFDDSYADYYQRFPRPSLDAMARMVLATKIKKKKCRATRVSDLMLTVYVLKLERDAAEGAGCCCLNY